MKFTELKKAVKKEARETVKSTKDYILNGYDGCTDIGLERYSTPTRWKQYQEKKITRAQAVKFAYDRFLKRFNVETEKRLEKLKKVEAAGNTKNIKIIIEWKKSRVWGYNPSAITTIETGGSFARLDGTASGCGYDKRSAAVAKCLNESPEALKIIYTMKEKALRKKDLSGLPYGMGFSYTALPYFEGGVGIECFLRAFRIAGYTVEADESAPHSDFYFIYK